MRCPKTPSPAETLGTGSSRMCSRALPKAGPGRRPRMGRGGDLGASSQVSSGKRESAWAVPGGRTLEAFKGARVGWRGGRSRECRGLVRSSALPAWVCAMGWGCLASRAGGAGARPAAGPGRCRPVVQGACGVSPRSRSPRIYGTSRLGRGGRAGGFVGMTPPSHRDSAVRRLRGKTVPGSAARVLELQSSLSLRYRAGLPGA